MHLPKIRSVGVVVGAVLALAAIVAAAPAGAALPPGYQVQRIDSPLPTANGGFGNSSISVGDADADGREDFAVMQFNGSFAGVAGFENAGTIWLFSGATGQVLRNVNAGDGGGTRGNTGADNHIGRMADIGSCANAPAQVAGQVGPTCASATVGAPDGVNEILIGLGGVDVGGVPDTGRAYVLDGKTLAILKRIDMPASERAIIAARISENPLPATATAANPIRGGFGRTVTNPRGLPPCTGNGGIGTCLTNAAMPIPVRAGDLDGGGVGDVIVGANAFPETGATAHPESDCAKTAGTATCIAAGRSYVYRGEEIAGSDPAVILDGSGPGQTPPKIIKSIAAQTDDPFFVAGRQENFGHVQQPVGDVGTCNQAGILPGQRCLATNRTIVPDGRPDYVIAAQRADIPLFNPDPQYFEAGLAFLYDGATGALLYIYNNPEPVANALFGFNTGQQFAVGNLGDTALPDVVLAGFQHANNKAQSGRAYVFSGNFTQNFIVFAQLDDPTPNTFGRFGNPTEGAGELVAGSQVGNEVLVGQFSAVQTANKDDTSFDVTIMNPANNQALQIISDPDNQPESGFGSKLFPIGDLNADGMLDFGVSSVRYDGGTPTILDRGRLYIFRSDANAVVPAPPGPPAGPAGTPGPAGPAGTPGPAGGGAPGTPAAALAGRAVELDSSKSAVKRNRSVTLRGVVEAFANAAACERGQPVQLQRRALRGSRFVTFQTLRTTSTGTFRSRPVKLTSTTFYRARVAQSDVCDGAVSSRVKVTVAAARKRAGAASTISLRNR